MSGNVKIKKPNALKAFVPFGFLSGWVKWVCYEGVSDTLKKLCVLLRRLGLFKMFFSLLTSRCLMKEQQTLKIMLLDWELQQKKQLQLELPIKLLWRAFRQQWNQQGNSPHRWVWRVVKRTGDDFWGIFLMLLFSKKEIVVNWCLLIPTKNTVLTLLKGEWQIFLYMILKVEQKINDTFYFSTLGQKCLWLILETKWFWGLVKYVWGKCSFFIPN